MDDIDLKDRYIAEENEMCPKGTSRLFERIPRCVGMSQTICLVSWMRLTQEAGISLFY